MYSLKDSKTSTRIRKINAQVHALSRAAFETGSVNVTIYAVVNTKGGVGKTTIAVHLAAKLSSEGKALLIDADAQCSAASWAEWRREHPELNPSPTTICLQGKAVFEEGRVLAKEHDNVVIDAGGRNTAGLRAALLLTDVAVVPIGASSLDSAALSDLMEVVDQARAINMSINKNIDIRVLLNRVDPRTKDTGEMLEFLKEQNLPIMNARICERVVYRRMVGEGATVFEQSKDRSAVVEIDSFFSEVKKQ